MDNRQGKVRHGPVKEWLPNHLTVTPTGPIGYYAVATIRAAQQSQLDGLLQAWAASVGMATSVSEKGLVPSFTGIKVGSAANDEYGMGEMVG